MLCEPRLAANYLLPVLGGKANPFGAMTMDELLQGHAYLVLAENSQVIGAYVLQGQGAEVWIQAAAGRAGIDLCDLFDDLIEQHGAGFETVAFRTYRRGLVKKALQHGYSIASDADGYTMRKKLK